MMIRQGVKKTFESGTKTSVQRGDAFRATAVRVGRGNDKAVSWTLRGEVVPWFSRGDYSRVTFPFTFPQLPEFLSLCT